MARTNRERTEATRAALIQAARGRFVAQGYAATGTPDIVAAAGVTRGALYHHFADKLDLFRAVVETEQAAVAAAIEAATPRSLPPLQALKAGSAAFLEAMAVPGRTRLLLVEAPAALGVAALDAIDASHGGRTLREGLVQAMDEGLLRRLPPEPLAALLSAAFDRAARAVAEGADRQAWQETLDALVDGLAVA
ncbi:TetR family transcriptional regulator [Pseudoxanthomonas suwonensis]